MISSSGARRNILTIDPQDNAVVLKVLSSPVRIRILRLLHANGPMNVNEISDALSLPQSTVATNIQVLHDSELIRTETVKATKRTAEGLFGALRRGVHPLGWIVGPRAGTDG